MYNIKVSVEYLFYRNIYSRDKRGADNKNIIISEHISDTMETKN